jgi:pantoate--beta-alanine ligase
MRVIRSVAEMKHFARQLRRAGATIALVPTMGALHEGHLSLVRRAKQECSAGIVSIFVNPAQFGPSEDLARYPRNLEKDVEALRPFEVDACFVPTAEDMYPADFITFVDPGAIVRRLEGAARPNHFRGVATIVLKLLGIVNPDLACFGQKDFQQAWVIRRLVSDFNLDVRVVLCPIVREADGLAASSRNVYLSAEERQSARLLNRSLERAKELVWNGESNSGLVTQAMRQLVEQDAGISLDYAVIVSPASFDTVERIAAGSVALVAARVGSARLIDNAILGPRGATEEELLEMAGS